MLAQAPAPVLIRRRLNLGQLVFSISRVPARFHWVLLANPGTGGRPVRWQHG